MSGERGSYVIMGPAPCHACGVLLWWGRKSGLLMWVERSGRRHSHG